MSPRLIILGNRALYFFTLFFLLLSVARLVLHIGLQSKDVSLNCLFWVVILTAAVILVGFRWLLLSVVLILLAGVLRVSNYFPLVQQAYQAVRGMCSQYMESKILGNIFISMGFINFSLSYVISARDKQFYRVSLGDVLQEEFPEHGRVFVCYTCLILVGLYSSGMEFHIVAFVCFCGTISSLIYTSLMALWFTFGQASKQKMVEYYLVKSKATRSQKRQKTEEYTAVSRLLSASDYIGAYYKATGFVPQVVAANLWDWLRDFQEQLASASEDQLCDCWNQLRGFWDWLVSVIKREKHPSDIDNPEGRLDDIVTYTQLITCAASAWQHILRDLSPEQQSELICMVLQAYLEDGNTSFRKYYKKFLSGEKPCRDMSTPLRSAVPLCGLISYLRNKDTVEDPARYWQDCEACLQTVYRIWLIYSRNAAQSGREIDPDTVPGMLFLLLETTLLTEISALEEADIEGSEEFWDFLKEVERSFGQTFASCAQFSEWGLGIVCSYKIDWFRSHQGMLSAYLTYQRLFGLIRPT